MFFPDAVAAFRRCVKPATEQAPGFRCAGKSWSAMTGLTCRSWRRAASPDHPMPALLLGQPGRFTFAPAFVRGARRCGFQAREHRTPRDDGFNWERRETSLRQWSTRCKLGHQPASWRTRTHRSSPHSSEPLNNPFTKQHGRLDGGAQQWSPRLRRAELARYDGRAPEIPVGHRTVERPARDARQLGTTSRATRTSLSGTSPAAGLLLRSSPGRADPDPRGSR